MRLHMLAEDPLQGFGGCTASLVTSPLAETPGGNPGPTIALLSASRFAHAWFRSKRNASGSVRAPIP